MSNILFAIGIVLFIFLLVFFTALYLWNNYSSDIASEIFIGTIIGFTVLVLIVWGLRETGKTKCATNTFKFPEYREI